MREFPLAERWNRIRTGRLNKTFKLVIQHTTVKFELPKISTKIARPVSIGTLYCDRLRFLLQDFTVNILEFDSNNCLR